MLEANPSLTPAMVKAVLMRTAQRLPVYEEKVARGEMTTFERVIAEGAGELNVSAALTVAGAIRKDANRAQIGENLNLLAIAFNLPAASPRPEPALAALVALSRPDTTINSELTH